MFRHQDVIDLYKHHGTHEQFHSEIKTDLDLERLPSGKFDTNDAIVHLASFAYNCLRLCRAIGIDGEIAPIRHPAKRRRLKTVLQEIMYRAKKFVAHARADSCWTLAGASPAMWVFVALPKPIAESGVAMTTRSRRFSRQLHFRPRRRRWLALEHEMT